MKDPIKRRSFLKGSLLGGAFLGLPTLGFTGRESSEEIVDKIVSDTAREGYGLRKLIHKIVLSEPFLTK